MIFKTNIDINEFDEFVENSPIGSLLQESKWAKVKDNWNSLRVGIYDNNNKLIATGLVLIRDLILGYKLYYLPRGPILDYSNKELVKYFFDSLKDIAKKDKAIVIKCDPLIIHDIRLPEDEINNDEDETTKLLKSLGFNHKGYNLDMYATSQPRTQAVVYLNEEKPIKKKLNYYLKNAIKKNVEIVRMHSEGAKLFGDLEDKTAERKNISLRNADYFKKIMDIYGDDANISFQTVKIIPSLEKANKLKEEILNKLNDPKVTDKKKHEYNEQLSSVEKEINELESFKDKYGEEIWMSGALIIKSKNFSELMYAGMDQTFKNYRSNSSFNDAIVWAKENDCLKCNLGGVEGKLDDSLTMFKDLYSPLFESYIGEFDLPVNKFVFKSFELLLPLAKKIRRLFR